MHDFKSFQFYEVKIYKLKDRKSIRKKKSFDLLINVAKMHVGVWEFTFFVQRQKILEILELITCVFK